MLYIFLFFCTTKYFFQISHSLNWIEVDRIRPKWIEMDRSGPKCYANVAQYECSNKYIYIYIYYNSNFRYYILKKKFKIFYIDIIITVQFLFVLHFCFPFYTSWAGILSILFGPQFLLGMSQGIWTTTFSGWTNLYQRGEFKLVQLVKFFYD